MIPFGRQALLAFLLHIPLVWMGMPLLNQWLSAEQSHWTLGLGFDFIFLFLLLGMLRIARQLKLRLQVA
ncbi:MAG: hypothetical protein ACI9F9_002975 [Candidatus Paceibacteria bacterium]|jgi:hypothetical protein